MKVNKLSDLPLNHQLTGELYTIPSLSHCPKFTAKEAWEYMINKDHAEVVFLGGYRYGLTTELIDALIA